MINGKDEVIVEEFIVGKVASVHSLAGFRGADIYIFPVFQVFGQISVDEKERLSKLARDLHKHIGIKHYLKTNFVINKRGKVYLSDINSVPDLSSNSHYFLQVCESVGIKCTM